MRFVSSFAAMLLAGAALSACATAPNPAAVHAVPAFDAARISQDIKTLSDDSFEGRGMGGANDKAVQAELMAANYFSTGIAAQKLAKGFGGTDGHKFVNGVLDKLAARVRADEVEANARQRREAKGQ